MRKEARPVEKEGAMVARSASKNEKKKGVEVDSPNPMMNLEVKNKAYPSTPSRPAMQPITLPIRIVYP